MKPSKELLAKMRAMADAMERNLHNDSLSAKVQIADTSFCCWAMVELAFLLQKAVSDELRGLE